MSEPDFIFKVDQVYIYDTDFDHVDGMQKTEP
jgi:hypothetical protein